VAVVIFQRGRDMEEVEAPKHCSLHWRYNRTFANRVGVDVERNFDELRREKPRRESHQPGEPPLPAKRLTDNFIFPSYWMRQKASTIFTPTLRYTET